MPVLIVKLNGVGNAAWIESDGGIVADIGGSLELSGRFLIRVGGSGSEAMDFGTAPARAVVVADGDGYRLAECALIRFQWRARARLAQQGAVNSPWLSFSEVSVRQPRGDVSLVSLSDFSCSLVGDGADPGPRYLAYPDQNGVAKVKLAPLKHPSEPLRLGSYLFRSGNATGVKLGSVGEPFNINHAVALELGFSPWSCEFWFIFSEQDPRSVTFKVASTAPSGVFAIAGAAGDTGNLVMAAHPGAAAWEELMLDIRELASDGAVLRVEPGGFAPASLWLGHTDLASAEVENVTGMLTPSARLSLSLELPSKADLATRLPTANLTYHDRSLATLVPATAADRHFGIRVAGLGTRAGGLAPLDADGALFELSGTQTAPVFHLKAGGPGAGLLVPKAGPHGARSLSVPVGDLALELASEKLPQASALRLDTSVPELVMLKPMMSAAPAGITSGSASSRMADIGYMRWLMKMEGNDELVLGLKGGKLTAPDDWAGRFFTADPSAQYAMIDHPGTSIVIDPPVPAYLRTAGKTYKTGFTRRVDPATGEEMLWYTAFFAALSYAAVRAVMEGSFAFLDASRLKVELVELDGKKNKEYVDNAEAAGLQVIYHGSGQGAVDGLRRFITTNLAQAKNPDPEFFVWPFVMGMGVLLRERHPTTGVVRFGDEIARSRDAKFSPCIAFDLSAEHALNATKLGWTSWAKPAKDQPLLWPRFGGRSGARLDPTVTNWRGIILRDLPLVFPLTDAMVKEVSWVGEFVRKTNELMMLDYAYQDEKGITWKGGAFGLGPDGLEIGLAAWKGTFEISLTDVQVLGAAGKVVNAEASARFRMPRIKNKNSKTGEVLELAGSFGLDLGGSAKVVRIDIKQNKPNDAAIETSDVPGFKSIAIKRIVASAETAQIEIALVAEKELAEALPFLSSGKPQDAVIVFNLLGEPSGMFELALPAEVNTNLFGRWPAVVQSMRLTFKDAVVELRVTGRLTLGMGPLGSVGVAVVLRRENGVVSFRVELQSIDISLSLGNATLRGALSWGRPEDPLAPPLREISVHRDRDMWGVFIYDDGGFLGRQTVAFRAGNAGEISYWIACIVSQNKEPINLGIGKLANPSLLLAHNADLAGGLRNIALDPKGGVFAALRPAKGDEIKWLTAWEPSASIGTALAASGFFQLDDRIVKSPVDDPDKDVSSETAGLLSGILLIDTGVLRVDGVAKLFTSQPAYFGMAVDFKEGRFLASFQTDPIKFGKYEFKPGRLVIGFGFKRSNLPYYLDVRLGWPERIPGTEYERDWDQALYFHVADAPLPVNSGWGGIRMSLDGEKILIGVAFRCGWSQKEGDAQGGSGGGYSIGYAIGGVVQFQYDFNALTISLAGESLLTPPAVADTLTKAESLALARYASLAAEALDSMKLGDDLSMKGELFGDVWGSAWLNFMGVTIAAIELKAFARFQICGSLDTGMTKCRAVCGFSASVKILCVTYSTYARYEIIVRDDGCKIESILTHEQILQLANARPVSTFQHLSYSEANS